MLIRATDQAGYTGELFGAG